MTGEHIRNVDKGEDKVGIELVCENIVDHANDGTIVIDEGERIDREFMREEVIDDGHYFLSIRTGRGYSLRPPGKTVSTRADTLCQACGIVPRDTYPTTVRISSTNRRVRGWSYSLNRYLFV